jgi:hypothetical protein
MILGVSGPRRQENGRKLLKYFQPTTLTLGLLIEQNKSGGPARNLSMSRK